MQVSVIVLTYNPNPDKLLQTLNAAVSQQDVDYEIILADDGSKQSCFDLAEAFLQSRNFANYRLVANPENKGTVQNCISGLIAATGDYVFLTSPGDLLYDAHVLADFYRFASNNAADLCFGNAVHYAVDADSPVLTSPYTNPANPRIYAPSRSIAFCRSCFSTRHWVTGAAFFRKRSIALRYFNAIAETSVYTEDTPSTAFALADNIPLTYFDRNMVWYESGGISTGGNDKWVKLIDLDIQRSMVALKAQKPKDPYVDVAWANACIPNRWKRLLYKLLRHPLILLRSYWAGFSVPKQPLVCTSEDIQRLQQLLTPTTDETR